MVEGRTGVYKYLGFGQLLEDLGVAGRGPDGFARGWAADVVQLAKLLRFACRSPRCIFLPFSYRICDRMQNSIRKGFGRVILPHS